MQPDVQPTGMLFFTREAESCRGEWLASLSCFAAGLPGAGSVSAVAPAFVFAGAG